MLWPSGFGHQFRVKEEHLLSRFVPRCEIDNQLANGPIATYNPTKL